MFTVRVLWFAALRDQRGCAEEAIAVTAGTTLADLYLRLTSDVSNRSIPVSFAQNAKFVTGDTIVEPDAEIVFLPPVGGG